MAEQDSNILSKLRKLFQSNIIIRKREDGKLVVKDVNYNQRGYTSNFIDRYNRVLQSSFGSSYARSNNPSFDIQRIELFKDYELMDTDPILSSALDIYADECVGPDTIIPLLNGKKVSIKELYDRNEKDFWVYSLDIDTGNFISAKCEKVANNGRKMMYKITLDDGTIIEATGKHLWVNPDNTLTKTSDLLVGGKIKALDTKISDKKLDGYKNFSDFVLSDNHIIVNIEEIGMVDSYDLVNVGENHIYAIEANNGAKIYCHNSTVDNIEGEILNIKTENAEIHKILYNLFYDVLNIQFNLWSWVRNMVKYGDFFLQLDILDKHGIINVTPLSSYDVIRMEHHDPSHPQLVQFVLTGNTNTPSKDALEDYEVAHFRLLSDSNFAPYGKSMIEGARKIFKMLHLMEDAMLLHRIMRAPERRVFKIDIGNIPPNEVENFMNKVINKMKKTPVIDQNTGEYNLRYNIQSITEDFFLPVRGSDSGTSIEPLPGLQYEATDDIEYLRNKMMASLRIPKAFLGYEEGVGSKATLAAEDVRFARTIERVQKIVVSELSKLAIVHLYTQGYEDAALLDFKLELQSPSTIHEQEKLELMSQKLDLASAAKDSRMFSNQWVYENIFDFNVDDMKSMIEQVTEDTKQRYRMDQIEQEGNDPAQSGEPAGDDGGDEESKGGMARSDDWGGSKKDLGRNEEKHWGRDRLGKKDRNIYKTKSKEDSTKGKFKGKSPLAVSKGSTAVGYNSILDSLKLKYGKNVNGPGLLNENSLIDEDE